MNLFRIAAPLAAALLLVPALAQAQSKADERQRNQQERIQRGEDSGSLTQKEAARLEKGQQHVQDMETKAREDGTVTPEERARIKRAQDRQSKRIAKQKHDEQAAHKKQSAAGGASTPQR